MFIGKFCEVDLSEPGNVLGGGLSSFGIPLEDGVGFLPYNSLCSGSGIYSPSSGSGYLIEEWGSFFDFTIADVLFFGVVLFCRNLSKAISLNSFFLY